MDRDQRLREIRARVKKATLADFMDAAREDVPWLLAEVERLREERDIARQMTGDCVHNIGRDLEKAEAEVLRLKGELADWEHRWKTAQRNEIAHGTDLERRLGEMGYFPPDPSGQGYVSAMAHCELALFAAIELRKALERLEILECHDEDTRWRLRPLDGENGDRLIMDDLHDLDGESERTVPRWFSEWYEDEFSPNGGAFDYPGSCVDG